MNAYVNPLDALDNPQLASPEYFGQIKMDTWFCILQKGVGKVEFDPQQHALDQRRTAVKIGLVPLPEQNVRNDIFRDHIAESKEWAAVVLPSIKALGITAKELHDKWVKVTFQPVGRTYTKTDPTTGETVTRDATTFKFLALYPNEAACRAAYEAERNGNGAQPEPAQSTPTNASPNERERETALKFVRPLIAQVHGDRDQLAQKIAAMPLIAKVFTVDSPEVMNALADYEFAQLQRQA